MKTFEPVKADEKFDGSCAILGLDVVGFSLLAEEDQIGTVRNLYRWITEALANHSLTSESYRWSPAGDGGFLTFQGEQACQKAVDVAFTIAEKIHTPDWKPNDDRAIRIRMGLHAGVVKEEDELGDRTNVWGVGINTTARILVVSADSQLLVSRQYFDGFIKAQRENDFEVGELHWRTVKHGVGVEVMNVNRFSLCLTEQQASNKRWQSVGGLWRKTIQNYTYLINDAMRSGEPVAAMSAAKFLLELHANDPVHDLCHMIGRTHLRPVTEYPAQTHILFSQMPPDMLYKVIEDSQPRLFTEGEIICEEGDPASSCFFPVSGTLVVEMEGHKEPISIGKGQMTGEFSLWIPNISRTARVRALDDGMFMEIRIDRFRKYLSENPDVANVIYGIIQRRIVENALTSKFLFPGLVTDLKKDLARIPAVPKKFAAGTELDLTKEAHAIFTGKVLLPVDDAPDLPIEARGQFHSENIVGIVSEIGEPDGHVAKVAEDTVAVCIPHEFLREAQDGSDEILNTWNAICGQRLGAKNRWRKRTQLIAVQNSDGISKSE